MKYIIAMLMLISVQVKGQDSLSHLRAIYWCVGTGNSDYHISFMVDGKIGATLDVIDSGRIHILGDTILAIRHIVKRSNDLQKMLDIAQHKIAIADVLVDMLDIEALCDERITRYSMSDKQWKRTFKRAYREYVKIKQQKYSSF